MKLNVEQSKHLAASLRAYGLGQLAAFGYTGIQLGEWLTVVVSLLTMLSFEYVALLALKDSETKKVKV